VLIVSQVEIAEDENGAYRGEELTGLSVTVSHAEGKKCARCWTYSHTVGTDPEHPDLCARCAEILK
jgi:isoleucyl-tRNA synthetase